MRPSVRKLGHSASASVLCALACGACADGERIATDALPTHVRPALADGGPRFKVATWNIRSGMGIRGAGSRTWDSDTLNCTDRSQPLNAWGLGLPQRELESVRRDPSVVALAVQESWNCADPSAIRGVLGFAATEERNGVALFARHGFSGPVVYEQIAGGVDNRWAVGGGVCLDAACSRALAMFSTHFGGAGDAVVVQARRALDALARHHAPRILMGDLNVFSVDRWNPSVPCTGQPSLVHAQAIAAIEGAGYVDAWKATQPGEGWTGMSSRPGCGEPDGNLFKRIDYVFGDGVLPLGAARFARAAPGADAPSDHAGVIAEFQLPQAHDGDEGAVTHAETTRP